MEIIELARQDITDDVVAIKINNLYRPDMTPMELYESTRGYWRISMDTARKAKYALSIADNIVREVYLIVDWYKAMTTMSLLKSEHGEDSLNTNRIEFIGRIAPEDVRNKYVDKSVKNLYKRGEANPCKYFWKKDLI